VEVVDGVARDHAGSAGNVADDLRFGRDAGGGSDFDVIVGEKALKECSVVVLPGDPGLTFETGELFVERVIGDGALRLREGISGVRRGSVYHSGQRCADTGDGQKEVRAYDHWTLRWISSA
jgi:hypothetical protein